ncbi:HAD family hydrolase [Halomonas garicola]|uniref:HAD family hydrolase n=1 Tax=Halomonas garicola TaxID=1690008 RepID=UPI00289DBE72|nr:HAD-IA family hydrolase [Halomonas garicola]
MFLPLLLFDCDGTLVDSEPLLAEEMAAGLNAAGLPFTTADYLTKYRGVRFRHIIKQLQKQHGHVPARKLKRIDKAMRVKLAQRLATELVPIAGTREALEQLIAYPRAVVSNGAAAKIRTALATTRLDGYFQTALFSGYSVNCWKPEPCLHLHAARAMGFAPGDCIAIDDALVGVQAALAAGMTVIHLNRFPRIETTPANAIMIRHMKELPDVVEQLTRARHPAPAADDTPATPLPKAATGGR